MSVNFSDFSGNVKRELEKTLISALHTVAGEVTSEVQRRSSVDTSDTKGSWRYQIDERNLTAQIGNPKENAIYEEFGTGEYALESKGRKGGWYIPIGNGKGEISERTVERYHLKVVYGKDGKRFVFTKGKKPKRMLHNAFISKKGFVKKEIENALKGVSN